MDRGRHFPHVVIMTHADIHNLNFLPGMSS